MKDSEAPVNPQGIALLRNVANCSRLLEHLKTRSPNLPGMGVFYGQSGLGKSIAAAYCANKFDGVYIECRSYFTKKSLLLSICKEMRLRPGRTVFEMVSQIGEQLALSGKPLIIDEMDHIVARLYSPDVEIAADLGAEILKRSRAVHRRVCVNIDLVRQHARSTGVKSIDLQTWGNRGFYTGEAPVRRAA